MPFEFSLQRVLSLTENEKAQLENEYSQINSLLEEIADKLFHLSQRKEMIREQLELQLTNQGVSVSHIREQEQFLSSIEELILQEQNRYNQVRDRLEKQRQFVLDKSIEQRKYEGLKSKEQLDYRKEIKIKEQKAFDEIAGHKFFYH